MAGTDVCVDEGVLWHGNQLIPEIKETLEMMRSHVSSKCNELCV